MEDSTKRNIRERWLYSLFVFGHSEFQKRWLTGPFEYIAVTYSEAICHYFDDLNLDNGYDEFIQNHIVSPMESSIISDFHNQLNEYVSKPEKQNLSDRHILKDIEWSSLTELAYENWHKLKSIAKQEDLNFMIALESEYLKDVK